MMIETPTEYMKAIINYLLSGPALIAIVNKTPYGTNWHEHREGKMYARTGLNPHTGILYGTITETQPGNAPDLIYRICEKVNFPRKENPTP